MVHASNPDNLLPPRGGIGLKPQHYAPLLERPADAVRPSWVEIHPQNYFHDGGASRHWLDRIAEILPVSFHSTGLSLGSASGIDQDQLDWLARLAQAVPAASISDHLSWSRIPGEYFPDLLPVAYTAQSLDRIVAAINEVQDRLARTILVENPSRMLAYHCDTFDEPAFMAELCRRSGCGILLDINNVVVSAVNTDICPQSYLSAIDCSLVGEIHVAGHTREDHPSGPLAIDDHGSAVSVQCWALYEAFVARSGPIATLVERDNNIPSFDDLVAEAEIADTILTKQAVRDGPPA